MKVKIHDNCQMIKRVKSKMLEILLKKTSTNAMVCFYRQNRILIAAYVCKMIVIIKLNVIMFFIKSVWFFGNKQKIFVLHVIKFYNYDYL